jgi:hypothetical protein
MLEKTKAWTARRRSGGVKAESARRLLSKRLLVPVVGVGVGMALYYMARTANCEVGQPESEPGQGSGTGES